MPGFFEAFDRRKPVVKKHTVTIQGNEVEVSLGKKLEIMRAGEDKYILKGNEIVVKSMPKNKIQKVRFHIGSIHMPFNLC